ncbi:MAG: SpoIIE family protein phosphatase [Anaerolineae bacterium]
MKTSQPPVSSPNRLGNIIGSLPAGVLFKLCVGLLGWLGFASLWVLPRATLPLQDVAVFVLLSTGTKCLGTQVSPHVTHSLVGVIDLAALYIFGPLGGAIVALAGGSAGRLLRLRQPTASWHRTALDVLFTGGLNVLMLLVAAWCYGALGGSIPLRNIGWHLFPAIVAASLAWFSIDHLCWATTHLLDGGKAGWRRFWSDVLPYSLYVELLPLPFAVLLGAAYLYLSPPVLVLMLLAILGVGLIMRELMVSLVEERRHVRELSTLNALGRSLLEAGPNLHAICGLVYEHCRQIVEAPTFVLQVQSGQENEVSAPVAIIDGVPLTETPPEGWRDLYEWMRPAPRELLLSDKVEMPPFAPLGNKRAISSALYMPLCVQERLIGLISLQSPQPHAFGEDDRKALALVASQAAMALHTAGLYRREQERSSQLIAIAEVGRKVAAILDLATLFRETVALVRETFGYYHVSIFTVDTAQQRVAFQASSNPTIQARGTVVPWGLGLIGRAASSGDCLLVNDVLHDAHFVADTALKETRSELVVPLKVEQRIVGVLDLQSDREEAFGEQDLFVMQALADQIAIAVEDSRLYRAQQEQAWVATALFQAAEAVSQLGASEEILATIVRLVPLLTGINRCLVFLCCDDEGFITVDGSGWSNEQLGALKSQPIKPHTIPLLVRVRAEGMILHAPRSALMDFMPPPLSMDIANEELTAIPLRAKGEVIGVLAVLVPADDGGGVGHRDTILTGIANQAAMALDNARMYAAQREEAWVSTALLQVATVISEEPSLDEALTTVVRLAPLLVGMDWSAILLWDEERDTFFGARQYGMAPHARSLMAGQYYRPEDVPLLMALMASTQPLTIQGDEMDHYLPPEISRALDTCSLTVVPLRARDKLLGALVGGLTEEGKVISGRRMNILSGMAYQIALSIETNQLYQQTLAQERLQREIELARDIQKSFLPECCPEMPGWQLAMAYRAARGVGGDYYDFIRLDARRLGLVIADVSDKGVAAALYMALSRTVMRAAAISTAGAAQTLNQMNRLLLEDARSGMFVSVFYAILDVESGTLTCARAGHNPPLLVRSDGHTDSVMPPGAVLGILNDPGLVEERIQMEPGDVLVMYTDGVIEAINEAEEEFGEERLQSIVSGTPESSAEVCVRHIDAAVRAFTGERPLFDDFTLLVIKRDSGH